MSPVRARWATLLGALLAALVLVVVGLLLWVLTDEPAVVGPVSPVAAVPTAARPASRTPPAARPGSALSSAVSTVDPAWVARMAARTGIPEPAVRAYAAAQLGEPSGCALGWTTLAGIGWVESQHGTLDGRTLGADGRSSSPILGPALDGSGDVAAVPATAASTALTGDRVWDHAVGPLQFLTSTWGRWAADGDGDGVADPHDLDDAALAAARYLCASGQDLTTGAGWAAAVFSYNHAQSYVDAVYSAATAYAQRAG